MIVALLPVALPRSTFEYAGRAGEMPEGARLGLIQRSPLPGATQCCADLTVAMTSVHEVG
jgi:hypothetical protein